MEICRQHPDPVDAIFVPVGGGGLIAGLDAIGSRSLALRSPWLVAGAGQLLLLVLACSCVLVFVFLVSLQHCVHCVQK